MEKSLKGKNYEGGDNSTLIIENTAETYNS